MMEKARLRSGTVNAHKKIRVLQFPIANSFGGITHYALDHWKWIDKTRFQVDFATMSKKLDFADEILEAGSRIYYISCYAEDNEAQFVREMNGILDEGYDVVHLHTKQWKSFMAERICLDRKVPRIIIHSHSTRCDNNDDDRRARETEAHYRRRESLDESMATDFWACSQAAADWLFGDRIPRCNIKIMKNAIDTARFAFDDVKRHELRTLFSLEDKFVIGNVGRLVYQKNQDFLLRAFAKLYARFPKTVLMLVGDGEKETQLKETAQSLGLSESILFMGKRDNVNELYQAMDLFTLPSNFEGLPITLIEAQTSGLQCLCSENITREVDITGNLTWLPLEEAVWAEHMARAVSARWERRDMSDAIALAGYDISKQIKIIEAEYMKEKAEGS